MEILPLFATTGVTLYIYGLKHVSYQRTQQLLQYAEALENPGIRRVK